VLTGATRKACLGDDHAALGVRRAGDSYDNALAESVIGKGKVPLARTSRLRQTGVVPVEKSGDLLTKKQKETPQ